ncbi:MAG: LssY C-terminal domain-containing protein [Planctomycetia bacterium]|nr:LssY C-terminal domain-containing protein [Planctomycetia bacterium]
MPAHRTLVAPVAAFFHTIPWLATFCAAVLFVGSNAMLPLCQSAEPDSLPHPALVKAPQVTLTKEGRSGDAVNVAFIGTDEELHRTLLTSGWYAADPITLKTSMRIAVDVVLKKPYPHAPVSDLYLWGRKQDMAFEQPVGQSPKQRHHVRFWRSAEIDKQGEPLWLGAATFDERVEISHTTGGITHRINADIDSERNKLVTDAKTSGVLDGVYWIDQFHSQREGRNGGGDPYYTDGRLAIGTLSLRR